MNMVDIAEEVVAAENFNLACEIYERLIVEKGPGCELYLELGNSLSQAGRLPEAFTAFLKAFRLGKVNPSKLKHLIVGLVGMIREKMKASAGTLHGLLADPNKFIESEPFICGLCLGTLTEPVTISCGHTYCRRCLQKTDAHSCSVCGKSSYPKVGFKQNVLLANIIRVLFPKLEEVLKLKALANDLFCDGDYEAAHKKYSESLNIVQDDHTLWSNRSNAYAAVGKFEEALADALEVIRLRPQWSKGYYRKGVAEEGLGRSQAAAISYMQCLALDENALAANDKLSSILHMLLSPSVTVEDLKTSHSSSNVPISALVDISNSSSDMQEGILRARELLDKQFADCNLDLSCPCQAPNLDVSALKVDMLECSLCYRILYNPVTTPCGHVFCCHCLDRSLDHSVDCPQCRGCLAEYLAQRKRNTTVAVQGILLRWFPKEMEERRKQHEEEMAAFNMSGSTAIIPIFVCTMAFPSLPCPLHIYEPRYRLMLRQVMESGVRQFGMCLPSGPTFAEYGTVLEVNDVKYFSDGRSVVDTFGGRRFRVLERDVKDGYHIAKVEFLSDLKVHGEELAAVKVLSDTIYGKVVEWLHWLPESIYRRIQQQFGPLPALEADIQATHYGPVWLWWVIAVLPIEPRIQLTFLTMNSLKDRLNALDRVLSYLHKRH